MTHYLTEQLIKMAAATNKNCKVDIEGAKFYPLYTLPTSATVMNVKEKIESDYPTTSVWRQNLYLLPQKTKMAENDRTLASYGIKTGETAKLKLEIEPATTRVMLDFEGYPKWLDGDFIVCYETTTVKDFRAEILEKLHKMGFMEIKADDIVLRFRNAALDDLERSIAQYGVGYESSINITFTKNHPPADTML